MSKAARLARRAPAPAQRLGTDGALMPLRGFSALKIVVAGRTLPKGEHAWQSHDGLIVISSLVNAELPGSGEPPLVGPTWHISVSRRRGGHAAHCQTTDADVQHAAAAFGMPAFDEDNHHPGRARHLFCPVEERWRNECECKTNELVIVEPSGYRWSTPEPKEECRGCEAQRLFGYPCPRHAP